MPGSGIDLAVSAVIFALLPDDDGHLSLHLPLVRRVRQPFADCWALPGGWVRPDEGLSAASRRTLAETTGLRPSYLEQLYTFGSPDRSPTGRVVSAVYTALVRTPAARAVAVGENVRWAGADDLRGLAFDHDEIVDYALWRLRSKVEYGAIAQHFLAETFTLAQLRAVHEAVTGRDLDPANFRRQVAASGVIKATDELETGEPHRPARLYRAVLPPGGAQGVYPPWAQRRLAAADAGPPP